MGIARLAAWPLRRATAGWRALPDFIIIGAQKSGTSSLFHALTQHPQVRPSIRKEVHYFDDGLEVGQRNFERGPWWYRAHFPLRSALRPGERTGEASPLYLFHPDAPARIRELAPGARLIALVRDPTRRAISHYLHSRRLGREPLALEEALAAEEDRLAGTAQATGAAHDSFVNHSYKSRGRYAEQLKRYLAVFPKEQLLVILSEDFFATPHATLRDVFTFIGVQADATVADVRPQNVSPDRVLVSPHVKAGLDAYFAPHNDALSRLVGRRLDWPSVRSAQGPASAT